MRKKIMTLGATLLLLNGMAVPAYSDVYVIVDANNVVVSGAIVCDAGTCGDPNSLYSRLTLKAGERYVLQGRTDAQGNNSGIGAQPNQILVVKEETDKNTFVAVTPTTITTIVTPKVNETQPAPQPEPVGTATPTTTPTPTPTSISLPTITETTTATIVETTTVVVADSPQITVTPEPVETPIDDDSFISIFSINWATLFEWLSEWFASITQTN